MRPPAFSNFWIKLRHWEYWPWWVVYIPIFAYWLWNGLRVRAIFYLSAANPGFEYGGVVGASKKEILDKIPPEFVPGSVMISGSDTVRQVLNRMSEANLSFPVIVKPDIGERGFKVELIKNEEALQQYLSGNEGTFILQEYINLPMEAGIFYYRIPGEPQGTVSSVVLKGLLTVTGDGKSSIHDLMMQSERAKLQIERLEKVGEIDLAKIPAEGKKVVLEPIGNHNRGTTFLDGNYLINQRLIDIIDEISNKIDEFYYGRFDVRCQDAEALYRGEFKVLELNGSASEPAHIYAPGFPLLQAYKVLFHHWSVLFKISRMNHKNGVPYMSFKTGWGALKKSRFYRS